jgi:hypothetical protein
LLWWSTCLMMAAMAVCVALPQFDSRLIAGVSIWDKPAKFFLAISVQAVSVAWGLSLLQQPSRGAKRASAIFVAAGWLEVSYMIFRASRGEASHFNSSSIFAVVMYALMGVGAVSMTGASAFVGWRIWQQRGQSLMREAASVGLMLGALLGTIAGGYLSQHTSHWIGGDMTDATGLPFFHWSTTGGDLRVAHFIGLHATQFVPLAGLSGSRWVIYSTALLVTVAMIGTFIMAVMGFPLLRS